MTNNPIMRQFEITNGSEFEPIVSESIRGSGEISVSPDNADNVIFQGDDGSDVEWIPGEFHYFRNVDFSSFKVKGTNGDVVSIVGGSWDDL